MSKSTFLSRSFDHLGDIGSKLRDLQGYSTLANELMQNADDVPGATCMTFDVSEKALIVDNDGVFSDCQNIETSECAWKNDPTRGHRCDFHRFRLIASGDKRGEANTTGAFGIGFIASYQITDNPELISAGRHWTLHEDRTENERIEVCPGCAECQKSVLPRTRFIFPWARDPQTVIRKGLRAEAVPPGGPQQLFEELQRSLPVAMLFLKRLVSIDVKQRSVVRQRFHKLKEGRDLIISDGNAATDRVWHLYEGDFDADASAVRDRHPGLIEEKRTGKLTIAIPAADQGTGLLCACLPTQHKTGLPFHINADFFPSNDRKRIIFDGGFQAAWNRAALTGASATLAASLSQLPELLGGERFWGFLEQLKKVADANSNEPVLQGFWKAIEPHLKSTKAVRTTDGRWTTPAEASLLVQKEEAIAIPVLEAIGLSIVDENLRPFQNLLRAEAVGVASLDVSRLCAALSSQGLTQRQTRDAAPIFLTDQKMCASLWHEAAQLLQRASLSPRSKTDAERQLRSIAFAPGRDGAFWPSEKLFVANAETIGLFQSIIPGTPFLRDDPGFKGLDALCPLFEPRAAIQVLKEVDDARLLTAWKKNAALPAKLLRWFEDRHQDIINNPASVRDLAALPIFPSSGALRCLNDLVLPGDFDDRLGLAEIVDLAALGGRRQFLVDLGARKLDFSTYARSQLPHALRGDSIDATKRRAVASLLADRLGELKDDQVARSALASTPLVECIDGEFRNAEKCYFSSEPVRLCLGGDVHFARVEGVHRTALHDLYEWLGVTDQPRLSDIVSRIQSLSSAPYSTKSAAVVSNIVEYLGDTVEERLPIELTTLRSIAWLPAKNRHDRWYQPSELYAGYQAYLFESQALFVDLTPNIQIRGRSLLNALGVKLTPEVSLVVKHLLLCADRGIPVNREVYRYLNDNREDRSVALLRDRNCLCLGDLYLAPHQVFWSDHSFGRYRQRLGEDLRPYSNLFSRIGVNDSPTCEDTLRVLREISDQFSKSNAALDAEAHAVLIACWQSLERALNDQAIAEARLAALSDLKCIPNAQLILHPPGWMFFENRPGLAAKFGEFIASNVIPPPLGASRAMSAAGVQRLGSAVETQLLECADPVEDPAIAERVRDRRSQFGRVLETQGQANETEAALNKLQEIRFEAAKSLLVRHRLTAFQRVLESPPEDLAAHYDPEDARLLFTSRDGRIPWSTIARELAIALVPEKDPGGIAAQFLFVLLAESPEDASATLDELGFAPIDSSMEKPPEATPTTGILGAEGQIDGLPAGMDIGTDRPPETQLTTAADAVNTLLGSDAPPPSPPPDELAQEPAPVGGGGGTGSKKSAGKSKGRPVLRSYVPAANGSAAGTTDTGEGEDDSPRSEVDIAGISRVLAHEAGCGRTPKEMPHTNPGYDIEARDTKGAIVRYIEVKSISGPWNRSYAVLSRRQFEKATALGDLFWLYVVERAQDETFHIYRIQNPATHANRFMFDDGWTATAEPDDLSA